MMVHMHGFDWETYVLTVMPVFADWLTEGNEAAVYQMYQQTRSYREERFVPEAMQHLGAWPRAQAFIKRLPRGPHTRREYHLLCDAERFTALSDTYVQRHPPQLYQNNEAVRIIWGAIVEEYCLLSPFFPTESTTAPDDIAITQEEEEALHHEIVSLLHSAGLSRLVQETYENQDAADEEKQELELTTPLEYAEEVEPQGIELGRLPAPLHLRGWLATQSVRAMALFELLACGRRSMPFGYRAGEPYEAFIGYLTPPEVRQLALSTHDLQPPHPVKAREDHLAYRRQRNDPAGAFRLIDEVSPTHAEAFLIAVNFAAQQGAGLICNIG
ncbi:MAG TPA: hypothetical protein VKY19_12500 [Ktedonosporobacter sp.]|jgi:hypothetical protein|nr:hypothetical protein [Ktedonosporobacter sp.]